MHDKQLVQWICAENGEAVLTRILLRHQVLGRRRADGSSLISVSEMCDGIVTFEDEGDAQRYGALLEAEGHLEVRLFFMLCPQVCMKPLHDNSFLTRNIVQI